MMTVSSLFLLMNIVRKAFLMVCQSLLYPSVIHPHPAPSLSTTLRMKSYLTAQKMKKTAYLRTRPMFLTYPFRGSIHSSLVTGNSILWLSSYKEEQEEISRLIITSRGSISVFLQKAVKTDKGPCSC